LANSASASTEAVRVVRKMPDFARRSTIRIASRIASVSRIWPRLTAKCSASSRSDGVRPLAALDEA
jgi:hypothetical protein